MNGHIDRRLTELGIALPQRTTPAGAYVSYVRTGRFVFISGQLPREDGAVTCVGKVGAEVDEHTAKKAARLCAINILSQLRDACDGHLDRVRRCVRLNGAVNSDPRFGRQPVILDGASELMVDVFGTAGQHTRVAVGVAALPSGASVEVDAIFEVDD